MNDTKSSYAVLLSRAALTPAPTRRTWASGLTALASLLGCLAAAAAGSSSSPRLEGWQNQARQWGTGVQGANSSYGEDRVVPVRWVGSLRAGTTHTLVLKCDFSRGGRGVFLDSLASYDATETPVNLGAGVTLEASLATWALPVDPSLPPGAQRPGSLTTSNVRAVQFGPYTDSDGVRTLPVQFTVSGASGNRSVVMAWGVHLASERIWGVGNGALQYPGASRKAYASLDGGPDLNMQVNPDALSPMADLSVGLTAPTGALVGEEIRYDITVSNAGPNAAAAASLQDVLPPGVTFVRATTSVGSVTGTTTLDVALGDLAAGAMASVQLTVLAGAGAVGNLVNTATVSSSTFDPDAANNSASASTWVEPPDTTPPQIVCPGDLVRETAAGLCQAVVDYQVTAADETSAVTLEVMPPSGSGFPVGASTVTARATDASGNLDECSFTVTVVDLEAPVFACPADIVVDVPLGRCGENIGFLLPTATDNCDGLVAVTSAIPSGSEFPIGETAVTLTARDLAGNEATCQFTVTVRDLGNEAWPGALSLPLVPHPDVPDLVLTSASQCLTAFDQSRWFRFQVEPSSTLVVTLTELAANYDLVIFKDIAETYARLITETDPVLLSAAFAPDAFSPAAFSADALSPAAFSPAAFSPAAFSPAAFSPAAFSPAAFSPAAFSPAAFSPDAYAPAAFSPAAFSPAAFSPAAFSPAAFSPAAFSPAAFSDAQAQSVIGVSAFDGTAGEGVIVRTWDSGGEFYVRVRGRNGVFVPGAPFLMQAFLYRGDCGTLAFELPAGVAAPPPGAGGAVAGGYETLILTDPTRMPDDGQLARMSARLGSLAARAEVKGVIVDLGLDPRVGFFQAQADEAADCPTAKNLVAAAIQGVVGEWWALNPLRNIVLVGGDEVIPFFRYPDQALLGPERNYVPPVRDDSASQASLRLNYVLGQDAYGSRCALPRATAALPLPGIPVGRLVEEPAEVAGLVEAYLETNGGVAAAPTAALVTGYDFLVDAAEAVAAQLTAGLGRPVETLITPADRPPAEGWTAQMLRDRLFAGRHDLIYLAGHFNAFGALAADYSTHLAAAELVAAPVDFENTLFVSAGCHSGYSAVNRDGIPRVTPEPDWAQACAQRQATLLAGTGYQYGDTEFLEYSERLYLEFFRQLRLGTGPVAIGEALVRAKEKYLAGTPVVRALHEKAFLQATLFGLPMLQINLPANRIPNPPGLETPVVTGATAYGTDPGRTLGLVRADLELVPTFIGPQTLVLTDFEGGGQVTATWYEGRDGILNNPAEPILPLEVRNVTLDQTVLRGVGFRGGEYEDLEDIIPLTGAATTEIRGVHVGFPSEVFFPVQPWAVNYFDALCAPGVPVTRLAVAAAQFRVGSASAVAGTLRRFERLNFRLFYNDDLTDYGAGGTSSVPGRSGPPSISAVFGQITGDTVHFSARVVANPAAGVQEVWVTYTATQGALTGRWQSLDLMQNPADSTLWHADLVLDGLTAPGDLRYVVQAVSGVGYVALNTRQGRYHIPGLLDGFDDPTAAATTLTLVAPPTTASFGSRLVLNARLEAQGLPLEGYGLVFQVADQQAFARTGTGAEAGVATVVMSLATIPGEHEIKVAFPGGFGLLPCWSAAPLTITPATSVIEFVPPNPVIGTGGAASVTAVLRDGAGSPIVERTVLFVVGGGGTALVRPVITDYAGRAQLGSLDLATGAYDVTAHFATVVDNLPGTAATVDLTDPRYLPVTASTVLTVDADAPVVTSLSVSPSVLRPPNHRLVTVQVAVSATDPGGTSVSRIVQITSNEPENGLGDGDAYPDWELTGELTARLRAERSQNGPGRTYTLRVETSDPLGNTRYDNVTVFVPK